MTAPWFLYAAAAAVLYGLHQIFTKLASDRIGDGLGGFVVEATAALLLYLAWLRRGGDDCVFSAIPKRRAAVGGADGAGRRGGDYGNRGDSLFQGAGCMASVA